VHMVCKLQGYKVARVGDLNNDMELLLMHSQYRTRHNAVVGGVATGLNH
jgi:hypothetical protein